MSIVDVGLRAAKALRSLHGLDLMIVINIPALKSGMRGWIKLQSMGTSRLATHVEA